RCRNVLVESFLHRWALPGPVIVVLLFGAVAAYLSPRLGETVGPPGMAVGVGLASVLLYRRSASLDRAERAAWRSLASGMAPIAVGITVLIGLNVFGLNPPAFGPVDIAFLIGYGFF